MASLSVKTQHINYFILEIYLSLMSSIEKWLLPCLWVSERMKWVGTNEVRGKEWTWKQRLGDKWMNGKESHLSFLFFIYYFIIFFLLFWIIIVGFLLLFLFAGMFMTICSVTKRLSNRRWNRGKGRPSNASMTCHFFIFLFSVFLSFYLSLFYLYFFSFYLCYFWSSSLQ